MKDKNLKKNFLWNIIGTTFCSFNSLFFMIIVTRLNGINDAGIFSFAFSSACLFYIIGVYSGRTYQVTEEKEYNDSIYLYSKIVTCIIMLIIAFLFCIIRNYNIFKIVLIMSLCTYKMIEAFSETLYAILQKDNKLYIVGKSLFFKGILSLILFLLIDIFTKNLILSCIFIIIVNILIILIYDIPALIKTNFKIQKFITVKKKQILSLLGKGFFTFGFTFLTLYVINSPKYSVDLFMNNSSQTILGIIIMPATIVILFCQFIIQPFTMKLKDSLKKGEKEFNNFIIKLVVGITFIGFIILICGYLLGIPVLELLYNINLDKYKSELLIIIIGATIYGITVIYSTALVTMRKTLCQFIIFIITSIFAMIITNILTNNYGIYGACASYTIIMIFLLVLYVIVYSYQIRKKWKK